MHQQIMAKPFVHSPNEENDALSDQAIAVVRSSAFLSDLLHIKRLRSSAQLVGFLLYCVWIHRLIDETTKHFCAYTE